MKPKYNHDSEPLVLYKGSLDVLVYNKRFDIIGFVTNYPNNNLLASLDSAFDERWWSYDIIGRDI